MIIWCAASWDGLWHGEEDAKQDAQHSACAHLRNIGGRARPEAALVAVLGGCRIGLWPQPRDRCAGAACTAQSACPRKLHAGSRAQSPWRRASGLAPPGPRTCSGVCPSTSLSLTSLTGWPSSSSSITWFSTSACLPACRRTPAASYMTMELNATAQAKAVLPKPDWYAIAVVMPCGLGSFERGGLGEGEGGLPACRQRRLGNRSTAWGRGEARAGACVQRPSRVHQRASATSPHRAPSATKACRQSRRSREYPRRPFSSAW
jgi:hypothetical protein